MKQMVICKACGFITEQSKLGETCPACGVSSKIFIPHDERISPKRKLLLALDLHPILVHFTQAYTATILVLSLFALTAECSCMPMLITTLTVLSYALPFTVIAAFAAGLFDGKIRFRKITAPLLIKKMILGALYLLLTFGVFACAVSNPLNLPAIAALSALAMCCASVLGIWGTSLLNSRFPG